MKFLLGRVEDFVGKDKMLDISIFSVSHIVFIMLFLKVIFICDCVLKSENLHINSLPNDKILNWFKLKAFADDTHKNQGLIGKGLKENKIF